MVEGPAHRLGVLNALLKCDSGSVDVPAGERQRRLRAAEAGEHRAPLPVASDQPRRPGPVLAGKGQVSGGIGGVAEAGLVPQLMSRRHGCGHARLGHVPATAGRPDQCGNAVSNALNHN